VNLADLRYADLGGADLGSSVRPSWLPARWTVTDEGIVQRAMPQGGDRP